MTTARFVLLSLLLTAAVSAAQNAEDPFTLVENRQYERAKPLLKAAVAAAPADARAAANLGVVLLRSDRDIEGAMQWAEKSVELEPANARYHLWLGETYAAKAITAGLLRAGGLAVKSKAEFETAVRLAPDLLGARQALFQFLLRAPGIVGGSVAKAREQAAAISKLDAYRGQLALASLEEYSKNWTAAEKAYRDALTLDDKRGAAHNALGYFFLSRERAEDAVAEFRRQVEVEPTDPNSYDSLADGLLALGKVEEAAESFRRSIALDASFSSSVWGLGDCLEKLGRRAEALPQYRRYLELEPKGRQAEDARKRLAAR